MEEKKKSALAEFGESQLVSVREAAHLLGVSRRTLERLVRQKRFLAPVKIASKTLYLREELDAYIKNLIAAREVGQ